MEENLFLSDTHPISGRHAVFEDNGTSAWLYLTAPGTHQPVADVWVYNRVAAPPPADIKQYRDGPPPAAEGYAGPNALIESPREGEWTFLWSSDGESVALRRNNVAYAWVSAENKQGYSRLLTQDGPWGLSWSEEAFARLK